MNDADVKFSLGRILATPNALNHLNRAEIAEALNRHNQGDWGDVCKDDHDENELSLREGFRLFSVYHAASGEKFWIITEADRSSTTVLMPEDY